MTPALRFAAATLLGLAVGQSCAAAQVVSPSPTGYAGPAIGYDEAVFPLASRPALDFYAVGCPLQTDRTTVCSDASPAEPPPLLGLSGTALTRAPALLSIGGASTLLVYRDRPLGTSAVAHSIGTAEIASIAGLVFSFWLVGASLRRTSTKMA